MNQKGLTPPWQGDVVAQFAGEPDNFTQVPGRIYDSAGYKGNYRNLEASLFANVVAQFIGQWR